MQRVQYKIPITSTPQSYLDGCKAILQGRQDTVGDQRISFNTFATWENQDQSVNCSSSSTKKLLSLLHSYLNTLGVTKELFQKYGWATQTRVVGHLI